jgi:hypothetical protein
MEVENLEHKNQYVITDGYKIVFQSYTTKICTLDDDKLYLNSHKWDYSNTTRRHFKLFINRYTPFRYENKQQWIKEIESNDNINYEVV